MADRKIPSLEERYGKDCMSAAEAQRLAHWVSQGPVLFEAARVLLRTGILEMLSQSAEGMDLDEVSGRSGISRYGVQVLLESALTASLVLYNGGKYTCSKAGWFLLNDEMVRVNMDFNHDVNYIGMFRLEESIREGRPAGLEHFGSWATVYEGLSQLPPQVRKSWLAFDHWYSDCSFSQALDILFAEGTGRILDVGGNTGRFALRAVGHDAGARVTVMDLPGQVAMLREAVGGCPGAERIDALEADVLDEKTEFPQGYDKIWMSQFLDCFSREQVVSILSRAAAAMSRDSRLYIMESFWDRQAFGTAAFALAQTSLYFTAIANGNSKMYRYDDMLECVREAGLELVSCTDGLGVCHSLMVCRRRM